MKDNLKDFIQQNKNDWDELQPDQDGWSNLEQKLATRKAVVRSIVNRQWMAAAAIMTLIISSAALYFSLKPKENLPIAVQHPQDTTETIVQQSNIIDTGGEQTAAIAKETIERKEPQNRNAPEATAEPNSIAQYSKLIVQRQHQMSVLQKEDPQLYKRFTDDLEKLEVAYEALKEKSKRPGNKEIVLEAMLQNLQFQAELLSKQLEVVHHINEIKTENNHDKKRSL